MLSIFNLSVERTPSENSLTANFQLPGEGAFWCATNQKLSPFTGKVDTKWPKGERLNQPKSPSYSPSVGSRRQLPRKRWSLLVCLTSSNIKPALKGEVAASATSRRRGCIGAALVCVNPSVNPPCGVLPAPRKGEPFDVVSKLSRSPCRKAGFHMAEPYFTLRKQYFTRLQADFTAHVSAPTLSSPRPDTRSHSLCAGRWVPRREGRS